jgi:hypothetical protein
MECITKNRRGVLMPKKGVRGKYIKKSKKKSKRKKK